MNESSFDIVLDVLAREIDMLRYQLKAAGEENAKLRDRVEVLRAEYAKLRAMIEERDEKHERD